MTTAAETPAARQVREAVDGHPPLGRDQLDTLTGILRPTQPAARPATTRRRTA